MSPDTLATAQELPETPAIFWIASWLIGSFLLTIVWAWIAAANRDRAARTYARPMLHDDGRVKWPHEQGPREHRAPMVTEATRALYGWELENRDRAQRQTRRSGANTEDAARRRPMVCGPRSGATNVILFRSSVQ